ncbi:MAG: TIGR03905 family TSCPD domain-containing protein [Clostridiales bacterium]|nr:TIGR03905 family TSCPD domain-containing protein [Clostridiales bacterium]
MTIYETNGVCSSNIVFEVKDDILHSVQFTSGCDGNLEAISRLVEGMKVMDVIKKLKGIECQGTTSCPDQLAKALEEYLQKKEK